MLLEMVADQLGIAPADIVDFELNVSGVGEAGLGGGGMALGWGGRSSWASHPALFILSSTSLRDKGCALEAEGLAGGLRQGYGTAGVGEQSRLCDDPRHSYLPPAAVRRAARGAGRRPQRICVLRPARQPRHVLCLAPGRGGVGKAG